MRLPTASGLDRVLTGGCEGPLTLPRVETTSADAEAGRERHAILQVGCEKGRDAALSACPEHLRPLFEALDWTRIPADPSLVAAEVAFAYDPVTGFARELGRGISRRYDIKDGEMAGTADVVALVDADAVMVSDWKFGWSRRTAAKDSSQLRFYALAACRAYGRSSAIVQVVRIMEDGAVWTDTASLDAFDLDAFAADLLELHERAEGLSWGEREPRIVEGEHCRYCPSFASCPAKIALLSAAAEVKIGPLTPETAAKAYRKLRLYEEAVERAREYLREYARANPIPLGDGVVYGPRQDSTKKVEPGVAATVLLEMLGEEGNEGVSLDVSSASIDRAIKAYRAKHPEAKPAKALKEDVLSEIARRGGLKVVSAAKMVEFKPKTEAA